MAKIKRIISIILSFIVIIGFLPISKPIKNVYGSSANKTPESYSDLVIFIQFSDTEGNFMSNESYVSNALKYYNNDTYEKSLFGYINTISYGQMHIKKLSSTV